MPHGVVVTGGTGYLGRPLLETLQARGHAVRALVRAGGERRLPRGVPFVTGDALDADGIAPHLAPGDTLVALVGTPRPSPAKAAEFLRVDLRAGLAALAAAHARRARHLVYVSVAHPAPVMRAYVEARAMVEAEIRAARAGTGPPATILRPWYVLGPGHRWPHVLRPLYALARQVPSLRGGAERLGLVTRDAMVRALVHAVEHPADDVVVLDVPAIRRLGRAP